MRFYLAFIIALALTACSTVETRIRENPQAFYSTHPQDQLLIRTGQIREGFTPAQVYIAWGKPSAIRRSYRNKRSIETWVYTGIRQEEVPYWEAYPFGFYGNVFYEPVYQSIIYDIPYFIKAATFTNGSLTSWEER